MARNTSPKLPKTPAYRTRAGYNQAIVTLTDSATKRRRDYWHVLQLLLIKPPDAAF